MDTVHSRFHQLLLFLLCWSTFAWFHQGGGWNQNARFAEVRAIVEQGRLPIDDYMVYTAGDGPVLNRERVTNGEFTRNGITHLLSWGGGENPIPANGRPLDYEFAPSIIGKETSSGDVGFSPKGHFHPNKPPGMSLLAVPIYAVAYHTEKATGWNPDDWRVLNFNAWLCSAFTTGLFSALGVVMFARLSLAMFPGRVWESIAGALTFGFATTFFPFGTLMFDHNVTAVLLLAAFAAARSGRPMTAGVCAGAASVVNYLAAIPGILFGIVILAQSCQWSQARRYLLGVLPSLVVLLAYNTAAFGSPFTLSTSFQNPAFKETAPAFLGMFTAPSWFATVCLTVSPWRGLFVLSPVLILAIAGFWRWRRTGGRMSELWMVVGIVAFFFLVNICFNGFHGGFSAGPRYLIPALPFLCLALVPMFAKWRILTVSLAVFSLGQQTLLTATDAQNPLGMGDHAWRDHPTEWKDKMHGNSLVWNYAWPLFADGRAWPTLHQEWEEWLEKHPAVTPEERVETWARVANGEQKPLLLAAIPGPVSANPVGPWEGAAFSVSQPHQPEASFASMNAGEFVLPASRWSIVPLAAMWIAAIAFGWVRTRRQIPAKGTPAAVPAAAAAPAAPAPELTHV